MDKHNTMSRKTLLHHCRRTAFQALSQYTIEEVKTVRLIRMSENITYRVETEQGERYLLRLNRNHRLDQAMIESELVWLESLNNAGIVAPRGLRNRSGEYVTEVEMRGHGIQHCTLMRWVEGQTKDEVSDKAVFACGALMARLHIHAQQFIPAADFVRPVWGADTLREDYATLGLHNSNFMSKAEYDMFGAVVDQVCAQMVLLQGDQENYGVIHSDLHMGNVVFDRGEPRPIDFGRCGYGYYLYDIAEALLGLIPSQKKIFLEGYQSVRKLPTGYRRMLEGFFLMACIENTCFLAEVPEEKEHLMRQTPFIVKRMEQYLRGEAFL